MAASALDQNDAIERYFYLEFVFEYILQEELPGDIKRVLLVRNLAYQWSTQRKWEKVMAFSWN